MPNAVLQAPGEGETLIAAGTQIIFKVRSEATSGRFSMTEYLLPPNFPGPPPHVHRVFEHAWYVVDGTVQLQIGDQTLTGEAGAFAFVPSGTPHTFANPSALPARLLAVDTPGGLEGYYEDLSHAFPPGTPLNRQVVAEIQQKYDTYPAT